MMENNLSQRVQLKSNWWVTLAESDQSERYVTGATSVM